MTSPSVSIVVAPRERFSFARRCLTSIFDNTVLPFELIYVDAGTPSELRKYLQHEAAENRLSLISAPGYLAPNQARNLAWREIKTKYTVFLDNDALVTPGWLEPLIQCAEETGAWVVGPLYLIGEIEKQTIHMAGGRVHIKEHQGRRFLYDEQHLFETPLAKVQTPLRRQEWDYVEFHCMLVKTDILERIGPLDENLLSVQEHIDLCLNVRKAGGSVYLEPKAVTSYVLPPPFEWSDLPYFLLRWSEEWNLATVRHFNRKWEVSSSLWFNERYLPDTEETIVRFARGHRRAITGLTIPATTLENAAKTPLDQAQLMIALFLSVDCDSFNLAVLNHDGCLIDSRKAIGPEKTFHELPELLQAVEISGFELVVQPLSRGKFGQPALIRISNLSGSGVEDVKPYSFLTLESGLDSFECWLAVDAPQWRDKATLRRLTAGNEKQKWMKLAGSKIRNQSRIQLNDQQSFVVRIIDGTAGRLFRLHQLENSVVASYLSSAQLLLDAV